MVSSSLVVQCGDDTAKAGALGDGGGGAKHLSLFGLGRAVRPVPARLTVTFPPLSGRVLCALLFLILRTNPGEAELGLMFPRCLLLVVAVPPVAESSDGEYDAEGQHDPPQGEVVEMYECEVRGRQMVVVRVGAPVGVHFETSVEHHGECWMLYVRIVDQYCLPIRSHGVCLG